MSERDANFVDYHEDPIRAARRGINPDVPARMPSGWAVMGSHQHLPGYCLLLHDGSADQLTELPRADRVVFMRDLVLLGVAVESACLTIDPEFRRINYEVEGNTWPHLHGHARARYRWEPDELRVGPVARYGPEQHAERYRLGPAHDELRAAITAELRQLLATGNIVIDSH